MIRNIDGIQSIPWPPDPWHCFIFQTCRCVFHLYGIIWLSESWENRIQIRFESRCPKGCHCIAETGIWFKSLDYSQIFTQLLPSNLRHDVAHFVFAIHTSILCPYLLWSRLLLLHQHWSQYSWLQLLAKANLNIPIFSGDLLSLWLTITMNYVDPNAQQLNFSIFIVVRYHQYYTMSLYCPIQIQVKLWTVGSRT